MEEYYKVLEIKTNASEQEVKQAYRDLVKVWHPDRFTHDIKLQKKAEEKLKEINEAYQRIIDYLSSDTQNSEWDTLNQEAMFLFRQRDYDRGVVVAKNALGVAERTFGSNHPNVAVLLNNLALLYQIQEQYAAAEPLLKRSLSIMEKAFGPNHPEVALVLDRLAGLYGGQEQYAAAEPFYTRELAIWEKISGQPDAARVLCLKAGLLTVMELEYGPYSLEVAGSLLDEARGCIMLSLDAVAEFYLKRAQATHEKALGSDHPTMADAFETLAMLYDRMKRPEEARRYADRAEQIRRQKR